AFFIMDEQKTQIAPFNRQFASKTVGQRAMQLFAGPLMNFLLAIVIFIILGFIQGVPIDQAVVGEVQSDSPAEEVGMKAEDRKSTRLNSSHVSISYAVFCLKKKN